jgi:hypothetical protein
MLSLFRGQGCAYLCLQVEAINCISPCLCPVLIGFNPLPTTKCSKQWLHKHHNGCRICQKRASIMSGTNFTKRISFPEPLHTLQGLRKPSFLVSFLTEQGNGLAKYIKILVCSSFWTLNLLTLILLASPKMLLCVCVSVCVCVCGAEVWTQGLYLKPLHQPFFCVCDGWARVSRTICLSWLQTEILLISASWVPRITDMSHQCPAKMLLL